MESSASSASCSKDRLLEHNRNATSFFVSALAEFMMAVLDCLVAHPLLPFAQVSLFPQTFNSLPASTFLQHPPFLRTTSLSL
jgi:hypothetical protein